MNKLSKLSDMTLFWIVTIIIHALKVIGLAPFTQQSRTSAENSVNTRWFSAFRFSKIGLAYNLLLLFLHLAIVALSLPTLKALLNHDANSPLTRVLDLVQSLTLCFTSYIIIVSWAFRQNTAAHVMNRLLEVDRLLSGLETKMPSGMKMLLFFSVHIIFNTALWISFSVTEAIEIPEMFADFSYFGVPLFVIYWFIVEYFIMVKLVARELERVNKNILKLKGIPKDLFRTTFFNDYLVVTSVSTHSQLASLKLLRKIRATLIQVSQDIVDFFSFPALLSIGCLFFTLVYNIYLLISLVLAPNGDFQLVEVANHLVWALVAIYPLTFLSFTVTKAAKEAKLTGQIVHKVLATAMRREIRAEFQQFSLQLLHEHVSFTANGFFALDCTMLNSILGATATYIIILVQLQEPATTDTNT